MAFACSLPQCGGSVAINRPGARPRRTLPANWTIDFQRLGPDACR